MEWTMAVNEMLRDEITKLNYTLLPPFFRGDVWAVRQMQDSLARVIDGLGEQSASAQGLNKSITTAAKLRNAPTHVLYLLKDSAANRGRGEVIGLLKVGVKNLFLWDRNARTHEVELLCVLDFFVRADRQRAGCGRALYDHMLRDMAVSPEELAIDGPSKKMEQFLARNYGVNELIHQSNNFSISPKLFDKLGDGARGRSTGARSADAGAAAGAGAGAGAAAVLSPAVGRYAAPQPPSSIASVIHSGATLGNDVGRQRYGRARVPRN